MEDGHPKTREEMSHIMSESSASSRHYREKHEPRLHSDQIQEMHAPTKTLSGIGCPLGLLAWRPFKFEATARRDGPGDDSTQAILQEVKLLCIILHLFVLDPLIRLSANHGRARARQSIRPGFCPHSMLLFSLSTSGPSIHFNIKPTYVEQLFLVRVTKQRTVGDASWAGSRLHACSTVPRAGAQRQHEGAFFRQRRP
ncbi:hypothetical protein cyc_02551 [Cyclospora cayetanensis]|uniref:Uncharacterized protein n=1 Tax=Cyclospora cayetanensis TaxID=88456 RepID=A0A1D3CVF8_9EIME|nr:hypothetical protein cyc_02551 [Cyclospora cayetanensis]